MKNKIKKYLLTSITISALITGSGCSTDEEAQSVSKKESVSESTPTPSATLTSTSTSEPTPSATPIPTTESTQETISATEEPSSEESSDIDLPELLASDIDVTTRTDYGHISEEAIYLGNEEGVTITVDAPAGTTADEILVYGDEELFDISCILADEEKSRFQYYVTGKQTCNDYVNVWTTYELVTKGEEGECYFLEINKLDSSEGRIAYVTPTGEKYHFTADCAGENANITTYHDAVASGYKPCKKCVS